MAFRTFADTTEAADYIASLDERWPDRTTVKAHLSEQLGLDPAAPAHVVEYCAGAGALAEQLLADYPRLHYTGIDAAPVLLALARARFSADTARARWLEADLNLDGWQAQLTHPIAAFVSLQSLHDLGDVNAVARIMRLSAQQLAPGGKFVYADLLADEAAPHPGRMSIEGHLHLLREAGFATAACTLECGPFGCFTAQLA